MYIIRKQFSFAASHQLTGLPESHPCSRLHGHNYVVTVELRSSHLTSIGFVQDYRELKAIKNWIDDALDHQHLNNVMSENPTAENIARWIYSMFIMEYPALKAVEVSETPKTFARYEPFTR